VRRKNRFAGLLPVGAFALLLLLVVACGPLPAAGDAGDLQTIAPTPTPTPASTDGTPPPLTVVPALPAQSVEEGTVHISPTVPMPSDPALSNLVLQAQEDLAQRLSVGLDQIALVEVKAVVWPDGGLGCPQPGLAYIQVQHEGTLIRLQVGKQVYNYHSGGRRAPFLCEQPSGVDSPQPEIGRDDD
jgi:hypothetical protein